jgi:hypothetical protein
MTGQLLNGAIPVLGGIYATLVGFRLIGKKPGVNTKYDDWHNRYGLLLKILGPLTVLFGMFLWVNGLEPPAPPSQGTAWSRYKTSDDVCSAEFPAAPKQQKSSFGGVESNSWALNLPNTESYYTLSFSSMSTADASMTDEERFDATRDNLPLIFKQTGRKLRFEREQKITENGVPGRLFEYAADEKYLMRIKAFISNKQAYRVLAVVPRSEEGIAESDRFLSSFRFEKGIRDTRPEQSPAPTQP